jgi:hypothetical protein
MQSIIRRVAMRKCHKQKVKALRRLCWGEGDIRAARELAEWMLDHPREYTHSLRRSLDAGVMITYARPFGENQGLGPLPTKFSKFPDSGLERFHKKMIDARNYIAAHNDRINLNSLLSDEALQEDPEKIQIKISANGESAWITKYPYLAEPVLRRIVQLCQVQEERLHEEATNTIAGGSYEPRTFTLGVDFP